MILVIAMLLIIGALVKILDLKRKREGEAVVVQAQISDAVLRDPTLFSLPITPTAHVPLWKGFAGHGRGGWPGAVRRSSPGGAPRRRA